MSDPKSIDELRNGFLNRETVQPSRKAQGSRKRVAGRFTSINWFVDVAMADLSPAERAVWLVIWRETKPDGIAKVSHQQIADRCGLSRRSAVRATNELREAGLIVQVRKGGVDKSVSHYRLIIAD